MDLFNVLFRFIFFGSVAQRAHCQIPAYSPQLEFELRQTLFTGYEVQQRPELQVRVQASLKLISLNYLDIRDQALSVTGYFYFSWIDSRLNWFGNLTYMAVRFLYCTEKYVWIPPILLENSVEDVNVISRPNVPMRIHSDSIVEWLPAGIFTTSCESKVTYWPLDTQECDIIISSWAYTSNEIFLQFAESEDAIVTTSYQEHGEWELIGKGNKSVTAVREKQPFSRLVFTLTFRRRPLFHILNTIFPVILMGFLTVTIFKLSPESGERVGLSLTILLAYAVYLSLISDSIPQTSLSASLLSAYLASILLLQTIAVLLTVIYLDIYFTSEEKPVPTWLQNMTFSCQAVITGSKCKKRNIKVGDAAESNDAMTIMETENIGSDTLTEKKRPVGLEDSDDARIEGMSEMKQFTWKEIALLCDKVTLYIYFVVVTVLTVVFIGLMVSHFNNSYSSDSDSVTEAT